MNKSIFKITALILATIIFISCKEKTSVIDESKPFSIVGLQFTVNTGDGEFYKVPLYENSSLHYRVEDNEWYGFYYEPIEYLEDGMKCQILSYHSEYKSAYVKGKKNEGWIPLAYCSVIFDKKLLTRVIKEAFEGNEYARQMLSVNFEDLTQEEAVEKLRYIIDYVGLERFKTLSLYDNEDAVVLTAIARLIDLSASDCHDATNPLHLLAEIANEETWKFLNDAESYPIDKRGYYDNYLRYFYQNAFLDSEGVSALMHAVKAGNFDTLKYFYENEIPDFYYANLGKTSLDNKGKIFQLIMSTKDMKGKSLADYVAECNDEKIKNYMNLYDVANNLTVEDCLEYLRSINDWRNFQLLRISYAPLPYTRYKALNFEGNDTFVFLTSDYGFFAYDENLNIRDIPGTKGNVIGKLPYGTQVTVLERGNEKVTIDDISDFWYKVSANGYEGWCFGGYLANPVKYEKLEEIKGDDEELNELCDQQLEKSRGLEIKWFNQADFGSYNPTVIKETKLLNPKGDDSLVKPLDTVEILAKIEGEDGEDLWDYGSLDTNGWKDVYYRYNYYLIRTKDYKTGIIPGSSLAHYYMNKSFDGPYRFDEYCPGSLDFFVRLMYNPELTEDYKTSYYAELFAAYNKTGQVDELITIGGIGKGSELKTVYLGDMSKDWPTEIELIDYRDFEMEMYDYYDKQTKVQSMYSFIFKTCLDWPRVSYNCYTVYMEQDDPVAVEGFYKQAYQTEMDLDSDYHQWSYCYFSSGNRKVPYCIFGEYEYYDDFEDEEEARCLGHHTEHLTLDPDSLNFETVKTEELDYLPEW